MTTNRMRLALISSLAFLFVTGCETRIDPNTGRQSTVVTVPGTAAHGARMEERWRQCTEYYSPTVCERRHRGSRPPRR